MDNLTGQYFKGYELQEQIAVGGFGAVYRARQLTVDREVAVKVILPNLASQPDFIRRFEAEAQIIASLEHLHIVPLYDFWRDPEGAYLVMRYLRGGSLHDRIQSQGALAPDVAYGLFAQVAQGLHTAHRNQVVHRDIKPGNIMLDEDGNAYLADFGIAKNQAIEQSTTDADSIVGSPEYLAPEQARGETVTAQTDIYSLGVVLYEMLTGEHPFVGSQRIGYLTKHLSDPLPEIETLDEGVNDSINAIVQRATNKEPAQRFASVLDMVDALRDAIHIADKPTPTNLADLLTRREQEVMQLIIDGKTNREIADLLVLAEATIKSYIKSIYKKLNVRSRIQAIARARDLEFVIQKPKSPVCMGPTHIPDPDNPYMGLRAFQAADVHNFFGRESLTEKLVNKLGENGDKPRFLTIVGPSGSGKSSVVRAGLIPALWRGGLSGSEDWFIVDMMPGTHPLEQLEIALMRVAPNHIQDLFEQLQRDERGLTRVADLILPDDTSELLVVIDQFEEVFTLVEDEAARQHFMKLLCVAATDQRSRVRVVVTLRADYYDRPLHYPEFGELVRSRMETILPLSADELERAISRPAEQVGIRFQDGLVASIASDVSNQPGALPLLQYALTELFENRQGFVLTHEAYQQIGRSVGALAKRAEDIFGELDINGQELAHQMFLRLVTLGEGAEDTRRRATYAELMAIAPDPALMDEVIDAYAVSRLLSLDHDHVTRTPTIEVAHEAMLREWERLRGWLNDSRESIRLQRQLASATAEWLASDKDKSFLLLGSRLEVFETWSRDTEITLTPDEQTYLKACIAERTYQVEEEQSRQARERTLERHAIRRLQLLVGVLVVGVLVAIGLTVFAFGQSTLAQQERDNAQENFTRAERIRLASQAQIALVQGEDVRVPALLAMRSLKLGYSPEADAALLAAVSRGFPRQFYIGHTDTVMSATFSPGSTTVLTTSVDGTARLWDIDSGEPLQRFSGHNRMVNNAVFLPDGEHILTNGTDGTVRQWELATGEEVSRFPDHESSVWALALSPDGRYLVTSDDSGLAYLWDVETKEMIRDYYGHNDVINSAAFSPDGQTIVTGSYDRTARLWDVQSGMELRRFDGHAGCACIVKFSPDGTTILTGSTDTTVRLWNVEGGEEQRFLGHTQLIFDVDYAPDGQTVASSSADHTIRIWDIDSGEELRQILGHTAVATSISFSEDGTLLLSGSGDNTARLWDVVIDPEPKIFQNPLATSSPHTYTVLLSALSSDGETIITGNAAGEVQFWDVDSGQVVRELLTDNGGLIADVALSSDEQYVLTPGDNDGIARLWNIASGEEVQRYIGHTEAIGAVEFSDDDHWILTASSDATARVWDTHSGELIREFSGHDGAVSAIDISPDGNTIITGGEDATARLWDIDSGDELRQFMGHDAAIRTIRFSPDGRTVLTGSDDQTARLWDVETGQQLHLFSRHTLPVRAATFSDDGQYVLTGGDDQSVLVWDTTTGEVIRQITGHSSMIRSVSLSPDYQSILVGNIERAYLWRFGLEDVINLACRSLPSDFSASERITYGINDEDDVCIDKKEQ